MLHRKTVILLIGIIILIATGPDRYLYSKNAPYFNEQGWKHLEKGDDYRAVFSFRNALQRNPSYFESITGLARAYYNLEAYELAFELYEDALRINPESQRAKAGIGLTLAKMGNYKAALGHLNEAVKLSGEDLTARYGIAYLYYLTGRRIWAGNALEEILRRNPYHYDSLLLLAEIKTEENRTGEALKYLDRAIETNPDHPAGYTALGEFFISRYLKGDGAGYLEEAIEAFSNAIAIQSDSYNANRNMGFISLLQGNNKEAAEYFVTAASDINNSSLIYSIALAHDLTGNRDEAFEHFLSAFKKSPFDSILRYRLEDFMVFRDYKIGHPARVMLHEDRLELAQNRRQRNLSDEAVMYLKRGLLLNPLHIETRELLMQYYRALDYDRFYIDELKELDRLYPDDRYKNQLQAAVFKRRDRLYHREGYSQEMPSRDVPRVLVINFDSGGKVPSYPDAGQVFADSFNFTLDQFGRMKTFGAGTRREIAHNLNGNPEKIEEDLESIGRSVRRGDIEPVDFVIYGTYSLNGDNLTLDFNLLDLNKGYIIANFRISESGREALSRLSLRAARRVYDNIPYKGRPLKIKNEGLIVNLGLYDGLNPGDRLEVEKITAGRFAEKVTKKRIVLTIKEADTLISYAEPAIQEELDLIDASDFVYPLNKRRAVRIE